MNPSVDEITREPVAIIGIGCYLPGDADGPERFWSNLCDGVSGVVEIPPDRWSIEGFYDPDSAVTARSVTKWGGFVKDITGFDAQFFGISPREAADMDPQQRLLLQVAWEALEDAGVAADRLAGSPTGVFVGVSLYDYALVQNHSRAGDRIHAGTGTALSIVANRISHRLDLRGPSVAVDTACSSSLVATDLACQSLWGGECALALAGGVNALLDPGGFLYFSKANMMSPDGRLSAFDARANGFVRGEGAGVVVLKPLAAALADRDRVYAVIRATAVNQDGRTSTITAPNGEAQAAMLREACRRAEVDPEAIGYVEAHGTGTPVGDPIEANAIGQVFGAARRGGAPVLVGAVKTSTGHLESAAGVTGLIKAALCLHHGAVPANLNFETPSPAIPLDELNLRVPQSLTPWIDENVRRRAAVNSFGFGGTNACAILEEAPTLAAARPSAGDPRLRLVPLSATSPSALAAHAGRCARFLEGDDREAVTLRDFAGTAALRRAHLSHRLAIIASSVTDLAAKLDAFATGRPVPGAVEGAPASLIAGRSEEPQPLAFVFAGQGGQSWAMARELLESDQVFRAALERFDEAFRALSSRSVIADLQADEARSQIHATHVTQPAIFAVQIGLVARWRAWGIEPDTVIGHSFGEVAAAYTAGALSLEDAAMIIYHRGRLQDATQGQGGMAAVAVAPAEIEALLSETGEDRVEIAAVNAPGMVTLAGEHAGLEAVIAALQARDPNLFSRILLVDYAAHSRQMDAIRDEFVASLARLDPGCPKIRMISTVTGAPVADGERLDADYWWRNVRLPVLFKAAAERALDLGLRSFLEIGPHATLSGPLTACLAERGVNGFVAPSLHAKHRDLDVLYAALGALHVRGFPVTWEAVVDAEFDFVRLPRYPWEKQPFWSDSEEARAARFDAPVHPLLGRRLRTAAPAWSNEIDLSSYRFIADHRIDGAVTFPGTGYLEMIFAAAREVFGEPPWELEDVTFLEALFLNEERSVLMDTVYEAERSTVRVFSRERDGGPQWTLRATARVRQLTGVRPPATPADAANELATAPVGSAEFYAYARRHGHEYGPLFQGVERTWPGGGNCVGCIVLPDALATRADRFLFHPALFDACLQVGIGLHGIVTDDGVTNPAIHLPKGIARLRLYSRPGLRLKARARLVHEDASSSASELTVLDEDGGTVATVEGLASRRLAARTVLAGAATAALAHYQESWQEAALDLPLDELTSAGSERGTWLIFVDRGEVGTAVAAGLAAAGHRCLRVVPGSDYRRVADEVFTLRPGKTEDMALLVADIAEVEPPLAGIVHLWSLDVLAAGEPEVTAETLMAAQATSSLSVLHLVQALARREALAPRLWVATSGARFLQGAGAPPTARGDARLAQAPLAGLARTIASEQAHLRCTVVDLDPDGRDNGEGMAAGLLAEITADSPEPEVALRGDRRYVNRLDRIAPEAIPPRLVPAATAAGEIRPFRLTMAAPGLLETMMPVEMDPPWPGPGELAVEVRAVGLNFHDVLTATGLMPEGAEAPDAWERLGLECAGVVAAVGDGVTAWQPGDRVMAPGDGCLRSSVLVPAANAEPVPDGIDFIAAATVPTAFMTAHYALNTLARLAHGERVLIHVATGGVGLAAIQLARLKGAEIFATAGSERKREYLRALGIHHVMDSRSLAFADAIMAATDGVGVDIVLNSLPGAFIDKGLALLAPYGRFLELGKRDLFADKPVGLRVLRNNNALFTVDLDGLGRQRPEAFRALFKEVAAMLAGGRLAPLPAEPFPISRAPDAFRHMAQAKHIGKVVVVLDDPALQVALAPEREPSFRPDGSYLVTGGLSGFGLEVARWMAEHGAGHLLLMSRSGTVAEEAGAAVAAMRAAGAETTVLRGDVTRRADVDRALAQAAASGRPLRGVVHAAMVLDDGLLSQLDDERFARALAPKMMGAWNLHEATRAADPQLDFFVLFSSVAAVLGSTGQGNYVAGNAFLDGLAMYRRALGLPALSVSWGALGGAGFVARNQAIARYLESLGILPLEVKEALSGLGRLLRQDAGTVALARIDWSRLGKAQGPTGASPRVSGLLHQGGDGQLPGGRIRGELLAAPAARRPALLARFLRDQVVRVLRVDAGAIEPERPLSELGLDSLTSFELKNRIEAELAMSLPAGKFLQRPTLVSLSEAILERVEAGAETAGEVPDEAAGAADAHPLSARQEWLWHIYRRTPEATAFRRDYELGFAIAVRPRLDVQRLARAFDEVVARHRALRTSFPVGEGGGPVQRIAERHALGLEEVDMIALDEDAFRTALEQRLADPFDLEAGPLVRLQLHHRPNQQDIVLLKAHHTVVDGWSLMLFVGEMFAIYYGAGEQQDLTEVRGPYEYTDFARWQRAFMASPEGQAQLAYWRHQLRDPGPLLELPFDRPRRPGGMLAIRRGAQHAFIIDRKVATAAARLATRSGTTRYTVLLGAFKVLLHGYGGRESVCVSASVAGRTRPELERVVGWFVNNVIFRSRVDGRTTFRSFLAELAETVREALANQSYPIHEVLGAVAPDYLTNPCALDQVGFFMTRPENLDDRGFGLILLNSGDARMDFGTLEIRSVPLKAEGCTRDLTLYVQEFDGHIYATLNYDTDLFEPATIARIAADYEAVLRASVADPDHPIARLAVGRSGTLAGAADH